MLVWLQNKAVQLPPADYKRPLGLALLLHLLLLIVVSDSWFNSVHSAKQAPSIINAELVDVKTLSRRAVDKQKVKKQKKHNKKKPQKIIKNKSAVAIKKAVKTVATKPMQPIIKPEELKTPEPTEQELAEQKKRQEAFSQSLEDEDSLSKADLGLKTALSYEAYIRQKISRNWSRSVGSRNGMEVEVVILLLPSGEVDEAYVLNSSGNSRFDRDAVRAVIKAGVFPKLRQLSPILFDRYYRKFTMIFRPEDLRD